MKNSLYAMSVGALGLAGLLALPGTASAQVDCETITTVGSFASAGSCRDQDKLFTYVDSSTALDDNVLDITTFLFDTGDIHSVRVADIDSGLTSFQYSVQIVDDPSTPENEGLKFFRSVSLDSDVPGAAPDVRVTKDVDQFDFEGNPLGSFALVSLSGNPAGPVSTNLNAKRLLVTDTYEVDQGVITGSGILSSATNTFEQRPIPEPATLGLLGLGLLGLRFARSRFT